MTNEQSIKIIRDLLVAVDNGGVLYSDKEKKKLKEALNAAIESLESIPDNATNGDVIMSLFPITEINAMLGTIFCTLEDGTELEFKRKWWFSPYKGQKGDVE